jgi:hypothetical protein
LAIEKAAEEAKAKKEEITGSQGYKDALKKLGMWTYVNAFSIGLKFRITLLPNALSTCR